MSGTNDEDCFYRIRRRLGYLPSNNLEDPPFREPKDDPDRKEKGLLTLIPDNPNKPYDMHEVIRLIVDDGEFLEVQADYARNIIVGFARLGGYVIGIIGNQPMHLAGVLDIDASVKGARFIRFCDAFSIPLITFEDVPGFLPGTAQALGGIIRHGAKLLYAYGQATRPTTPVIPPKASAGAYAALRRTLLEELLVRSALPVMMERRRIVLEVEADHGAAQLRDELLRAAPEGLRITPLRNDDQTLVLRVQLTAETRGETRRGVAAPHAIDTPDRNRY